MLGTGNALVTRCYNTCFTLHGEGGALLLVDAGGGNGILTQLERAGIPYDSIHDLFVTHAHTDHLAWPCSFAITCACGAIGKCLAH